jgi:adenylosuccinate synthase
VLKDYLIDVPLEVNSALDKGENVLIEGTQGTHLSLWHGTYPFVTTISEYLAYPQLTHFRLYLMQNLPQVEHQ